MVALNIGRFLWARKRSTMAGNRALHIFSVRHNSLLIADFAIQDTDLVYSCSEIRPREVCRQHDYLYVWFQHSTTGAARLVSLLLSAYAISGWLHHGLGWR